jgi:hypothetical protein
MTTIATRNEPAVRKVLDMPDEWIVATIVALGFPTAHATKLKRRAVAEFTTIDTFGGERFDVGN